MAGISMPSLGGDCAEKIDGVSGDDYIDSSKDNDTAFGRAILVDGGILVCGPTAAPPPLTRHEPGNPNSRGVRAAV